MPKVFLLLALFLSSAPSWSKDATWYFLSMEDGCVSLDEGYKSYPYLSRGTNPPELFGLFRKQFGDATMQPFVSAAAGSHKLDGTTASAAERKAYKSLTSSNAFLISSVQAGVEVGVFTEVACKALGGLSGK
jgi:hypothetical protein